MDPRVQGNPSAARDATADAKSAAMAHGVDPTSGAKTRASDAHPAASSAGSRAPIRLREDWRWLVVGIVWVWMTIGAWMYVHDYAARIPVWDDMDLVPLIAPGFHWTIEELWALHNEHRIPLPRVLGAWLFEITGDVRTLMFAQVLMLAAVSLAAIVVARKVRGRTSVVDAVFPLLWLHTGNCENLLMGFQIALVLPTVLVCAVILVAVARQRRGFGPLEALFVGLAVLALPMCGGHGLVQGGVLAAGLVLATVVSWRQPELKLRLGAMILAVLLALTAMLGVSYLIGFEYPDHTARTLDVMTVLGGGLRNATLVFASAGERWWPWSGVAMAALILATSALLLFAWRKNAGDRVRVGALAFGLAATVALALSIGYGRAGHGTWAAFAVRYVPFPSPIVLVVALAWMLYGVRAWRWLVPGALAIALLVAHVTVNAEAGRHYGVTRQLMAAEIENDIRSGLGPAQFTAKWAGVIHPQQQRLFVLVRQMAAMRLPPFETMSDALRERYTWTMMNLPPSRVESERKPVVRWLGDVWPVLLTPLPCALHFEPAPDVTRVVGSFGILDAAIQSGKTGGVRLIVSSSEADATELTVLHDQTIDPVRRPEERGGHTFRLDLPENHQHVVIEVTWPPGAPRGYHWAFLAEINFQ